MIPRLRLEYPPADIAEAAEKVAVYMRQQGIVRFGHLRVAESRDPDWAAIHDKRMSELSESQKQDALELWLRRNYGWFGVRDHEAGKHIKFLLDRLDEARQP